MAEKPYSRPDRWISMHPFALTFFCLIFLIPGLIFAENQSGSLRGFANQLAVVTKQISFKSDPCDPPKSIDDQAIQQYYPDQITPGMSLQEVPFDALEFHPGLDKQELTAVMQKAYDDLYGVGFKKIGHGMDFFHGHTLKRKKANGDEEPFAILFHTQEFGERFDVEKRSWIVYLDSKKVENANRYRYDEMPKGWDKDPMNKYVTWESLIEHGTTVPSTMDKEKLGQNIIVDNSYPQFNFSRIVCQENRATDDNNLMHLSDNQGQKVCLYFHTRPPLMK